MSDDVRTHRPVFSLAMWSIGDPDSPSGVVCDACNADWPCGAAPSDRETP